MPGGSGGIIEIVGDDASVETDGCAWGVVPSVGRVNNCGVWHPAKTDGISSAVNNLNVRWDPAEGGFRRTTGLAAIYVRVSNDAFTSGRGASIQAGVAGAIDHFS